MYNIYMLYLVYENWVTLHLKQEKNLPVGKTHLVFILN